MSDYLDHFREHGYAVVEGAFDALEVRELSDAFDRLYAQGLAHGRSFRHRNTYFHVAEDANLGAIVRMVQWPSYTERDLDRYRLDERMLEILEPLIGDSLKQIINQLHWKPPGAAAVEFGYHQDSRFRRPRSAYRDLAGSYVQTGIAVDRHRRANGAMKVYPGSHRLGEVRFESPGRVMHQTLSEDDLLAIGLDPARLVDLVLEPGDVALWHVHTIHGSGPNRSEIDRRLYINGYVTAANCDRGEWAFRDGESCALGEPVLVHYDDLYVRPEPHYIDAD